MARSIFGWDLPPGCTDADIERAAGSDIPPCCKDCEADPCDKPEICEKYKTTKAEFEEMVEEERRYYEERFKED